MFLAKDVETSFFPVINEFEIQHIHEVNNGIQIAGTMNKVRSCKFRDMMVYIETDQLTHPVAADFVFNDPASRLSTRAAIPQAWGPWVIFIPYKYDRASLNLFVTHSCHSFYTTHTKLASFDLTRSEDGSVQLIR